MSRLHYFHCEPEKLLNALAQMRAPEGYVYVVVLLRIYETRGPCRDTLDALATRTRLNRRVVSEALDRLFKAGKLRREGDGIMNDYAAEKLAIGNDLHEKRVRAGAAGGKRRAEKEKGNQAPPPSTAKAELNQLKLEVKEDSPSPPSEARPHGKKPTRLPQGWQPSEVDRAFAALRGLAGVTLDDEVAKFANHWHSASGQKATSPDWPARWRTWVINWQSWRGGAHGGVKKGVGASALAARLRAGAAAEPRPAGRPDHPGPTLELGDGDWQAADHPPRA